MEIRSPRPTPTPTRNAPTSGAVANASVDRFEASATTALPSKAAMQAAVGPSAYYDASADAVQKERYYQGIDSNTDSRQMYDQLSQLVKRTHREVNYDPEKRLFPWVDVRPNLRLQSVYSAQPVATDAPIKYVKQSDFEVKTRVQTTIQRPGKPETTKMVNRKIDYREEAKTWGQALLSSPLDGAAIAAKIALVEGKRFYNCEHVVPQHFFDHKRTPKSDLHHLFTCERNANSIRGHRRFAELEQRPEDRVSEGWAPKNSGTFEPDAGKGAIARAVLYFLLRYPGTIGDAPEEFTAEDIKMFVRWHKEDPVSLHEQHRNQAIQQEQGNRNPLIDHPEWVERTDFTQGLFQPRK